MNSVSEYNLNNLQFLFPLMVDRHTKYFEYNRVVDYFLLLYTVDRPFNNINIGKIIARLV